MQLQAELQRGIHPLLTELGAAKAVRDFRVQLMAYAQGQWPFNDPLREDGAQPGRPVLQWWRDLERHPHARVLAVSVNTVNDTTQSS